MHTGTPHTTAKARGADAHVRSVRPGLTRRQMSELRRAWFARCGAPGMLVDEASSAGAVRVGVERIAAHLAQASPHRPVSGGRMSSLHLADLASAIACIDGCAGAWEALGERFERSLVRAAEPHEGYGQAVMTTRRLLNDVRRATVGGGAPADLDLRTYTGAAGLGAWLSRRLMGRVGMRLAVSRGGALTQDPGRQRLRTALDRLQRERERLDRIERQAQAVRALATPLYRITGSESAARGG